MQNILIVLEITSAMVKLYDAAMMIYAQLTVLVSVLVKTLQYVK